MTAAHPYILRRPSRVSLQRKRVDVRVYSEERRESEDPITLRTH